MTKESSINSFQKTQPRKRLVRSFMFLMFSSLTLTIGGCLEFGEDIELSGEEVDNTILAKVTELTGVIFPDGMKGENYIYYGSGIDPALIIKVSIPKNKKEEFLKNIIFISGDNKQPYIHLGKEKNWYKVDSLMNPVYTLYNFPNGDMIECSVGEESEETIVYLSWITL